MFLLAPALIPYTTLFRSVLEVRIAPARASDSASPTAMAPKSIADVLETTIADAAEFFRHDKEVLRRLEPLIAVGLEYMTLGQPRSEEHTSELQSRENLVC